MIGTLVQVFVVKDGTIEGSLEVGGLDLESCLTVAWSPAESCHV